jgi:ureidoglycolate amidohydrolase
MPPLSTLPLLPAVGNDMLTRDVAPCLDASIHHLIMCMQPTLQERVASGVINQDPPATCAPDITSVVEASAQALGLSTKHMVSRAYHDSLFMAR